MSDMFNFRRFALLFKKTTTEGIRHHLMALVVLTGMLVVVFGFCTLGASQTERPIEVNTQFIVFNFFFLLCGPIFTSTVYGDLSEKRRKIASLTLPVTHFERYLVGWINSFILFPLVFFFCFYAIDWLFLFVIYKNQHAQLVNVFSVEDKYYVSLIAFVVLQSITFLGAAGFEKNHFVKTALMFFAVGLLLLLVNHYMIRALISAEAYSFVPFRSISIRLPNGSASIRLSTLTEQIYGLVLLATLVLLCWVSAFFKIREKQV